MKFALKFRGRNKQQPVIQEAVKPVVEPLERRLMLSTHRHSHTLVPSEILTGGFTRFGSGAPTGEKLTQMKHLYGMDTLNTPNPAFPVFSNAGTDQFVVVIGAFDPNYNDTLTRKSNINKWSAGEGVGTIGILEDPLPFGGVSPEAATDANSEIETTSVIEWVHGMAPLAHIAVIEVPIQNGVIAPAELSLAIQESVRLCQANGTPGPINNSLPGGVVVMGLSSVGEDATLSAQYDALFSYKSARSVSFIAPTGELGGTVSMPATSPWVTAVGDSFFQTDTAGNRVFEVADPQSGGGASGVEAVPAFQAGLTVGGKRLRTRAVPDLVMGGHNPPSITPGGTATGLTGLDIYWDPTPDNSDPAPWGTIQGSQISAAMFAGVVADVNELRNYTGLGPIGRDLNNEIYAAYHNNPSSFVDINRGNNTLFQATNGYDLATGLGAPNLATLIPILGGVSTVNAPVKFTGQEIFSFTNTPASGGSILAFQGTGSATIGTQFIQLLLTASSTLNISSDGGLTTTVYTAVLNAPLITRGLNNAISGFGSVTVTAATTIPGTGTGGTVTPPTTTSETFNVTITGKVSRTKRGNGISGSIFSVDTTGKRLKFGLQDVFQGNFST